MTGRQLADALHVVPSTVSQWENGKRTPHHKDVDRLEKRLGTNGYLKRLLVKWLPREVAHEWLGKWIWIEEQSTMLWSFETTVIPGLLQTEDYARAVLPADELVAIRLERQQILQHENPPVLVVVLAQSVLSQQIGDAATMYEQFGHLIAMAERENIVVHVVPPDAKACAKFTAPFVVANFDGGNEVAYVDDQLRGRVVEHPEDVAALRRMFELFRSDALSGRQSVELIREMMEQWKPERHGVRRRTAQPTEATASSSLASPVAGG